MRVVTDDHDGLAVEAAERLFERADRLIDDALLVGRDVDGEGSFGSVAESIAKIGMPASFAAVTIEPMDATRCSRRG